jgi:hypothetical protein
MRWFGYYRLVTMFYNLRFCCLSLGLTVSMTGSGFAAVNLIRDGGFESVLSYFSDNSPNSPWALMGAHINEPQRAHGGFNFADSTFLRQFVSTEPGKTYRLALFVARGDQNFDSTIIRLNIDWGATTFGPFAFTNSTQYDWMYFTRQFTAISNNTRVVLRGVEGFIAIDDVELTLAPAISNSPPVVTIVEPVTSLTATELDLVAFEAEASDPDGTVYQVGLYVDEWKLADFRAPPYRTAYRLTPGSHVIRAVATDNLGAQGSSAAVSISVLDLPDPPIIVTSPRSQWVTEGAYVRFDVTARSDPEPDYQWYFNGIPLAGSTRAHLVLSGVTSENEGRYAVWVTNPGGSAQSAAAFLKVNAKPGGVTGGAIYLSNYESGMAIVAMDGSLAPPGTLVTVLGAQVGGVLAPLASTRGETIFRIIEPGYFDGGFGPVPGVGGGETAIFQVLAWQEQGDRIVDSGSSSLFMQTVGYDVLPPSFPSPFVLLIPGPIQLRPVEPEQSVRLGMATQPLQLICKRPNEGGIALHIVGLKGAEVALERSYDLRNWFPMVTVRLSEALVEFAPGPAAAASFYRALYK